MADYWFAVGAVDSLDYRLVSRRVWLYGATTRRWALLLSFAPPGGFLDDSVAAGQRLHADLHFYPGPGSTGRWWGSSWTWSSRPVRRPPRRTPSLLERFADLLAADPWATRMPAVVRAAACRPSGPAGAGGCARTAALREVVELAASPGRCSPARWASRSPSSASGARRASGRSACCPTGSSFSAVVAVRRLSR